jgi:RNA recognition motif-containing protein
MDIYCGNLAYATTDDGLKAAFAAYGEVTSARVVTDRMTGRSKGFGFVEMPNAEQAEAAIAALNGSEMDGRPIRVNQSQPKPQDDRRGGGRGGFGGGRGGRRLHGQCRSSIMGRVIGRLDARMVRTHFCHP